MPLHFVKVPSFLSFCTVTIILLLCAWQDIHFKPMYWITFAPAHVWICIDMFRFCACIFMYNFVVQCNYINVHEHFQRHLYLCIFKALESSFARWQICYVFVIRQTCQSSIFHFLASQLPCIGSLQQLISAWHILITGIWIPSWCTLFITVDTSYTYKAKNIRRIAFRLLSEIYIQFSWISMQFNHGSGEFAFSFNEYGLLGKKDAPLEGHMVLALFKLVRWYIQVIQPPGFIWWIILIRHLRVLWVWQLSLTLSSRF